MNALTFRFACVALLVSFASAWVPAQAQAVGPYGYTGREPDASGLMFYRNRYLDPSLGRFTQRDPLARLFHEANLSKANVIFSGNG